MDETKLNPGIRKTVAWLREWGFDTQDSGDGATHDHECDQPVPYVHIVVQHPADLVEEAHRLKQHLWRLKVEVTSMNEEGTAKAIEASYNPADKLAVLTLWNVGDADLFPEANSTT